MPKSKRDKQISLTKTKKFGRVHKEGIVVKVREGVDEYSCAFVFSVQNMRSKLVVDIRQDMKEDSKLVMGKRKVMQLALGRNVEEEYAPKLHKMSKYLTGHTGLLFTNRRATDVKKQFAAYREPDFARSGNVVDQTIVLPVGPLPQFPFNMEPQLRKLGMPTFLDKGVVTLLKEYVVCTEGQAVTPEQAQMLKLLDMRLGAFKMTLLCCWQKKDGGKFTTFVKSKKGKGHAMEVDEE